MDVVAVLGGPICKMKYGYVLLCTIVDNDANEDSDSDENEVDNDETAALALPVASAFDASLSFQRFDCLRTSLTVLFPLSSSLCRCCCPPRIIIWRLLDGTMSSS